MRIYLKTLFAVMLLLFVNKFALAQDFKVTITSTDDCSGYLKPLKAGNSLQFQIAVKNNRADTCKVSIQKENIGYVSSWISIDDNSQDIFPGQTINFLLTIKVPTSAAEGEYSMFLNFNAFDKKNNNHSFIYYT